MKEDLIDLQEEEGTLKGLYDTTQSRAMELMSIAKRRAELRHIPGA
jgi:hypothetical protein